MHYYDMVHLIQENQQKLMKEAEKHRLLSQTRQKSTHPVYAPVMAKVGEILSEMGDTLQVRYRVSSTPTLEMCNPVKAENRG